MLHHTRPARRRELPGASSPLSASVPPRSGRPRRGAPLVLLLLLLLVFTFIISSNYYYYHYYYYYYYYYEHLARR